MKAIKVLLRQAKFSDIKEVMEVNERAMSENYTKDYLVSIFPKSKAYSFVAVSDGRIIGYIISTDEIVISFAVDEKYRRKGLGRTLLQCSLEAWLNINGKKEKILKLHMRVSNQALKLYKMFGFTGEESPKLSNYYVNEKGQEDAFELTFIPTSFPKLDKYITPKKITLS